jgi:1,4-dihydroxy-2-naphthoyl-CoA hydrolase
MSELIHHFTTTQVDSLPGILGFEWVEVRNGFIRGRFEILRKHFSPHGYLHGAAIVALADSACGFGCLSSLPHGASGFATGELKANFIGTADTGFVSCNARLIHAGRSTQVWDAEIASEQTRKDIALFRYTQMIFYPPVQRTVYEPNALSPEPKEWQ